MMMQRKGIPRSHSNASYFHANANAKSILPTTDRKTVPGTTRTLLGPRRCNGQAVDGAIGSISVATVGRVMAMLAIFFVTATILKTVVYGSAIAEELAELDSTEGGGGGGGGGGLRHNYWQTLDEQKLPLSEYPSIQYALDHSDIVLLYFAASWCPMSTPITKLLDEKFGEILLPPEDKQKGNSLSNKRVRRPISLVYVSSDSTEKEMIGYARKNWIPVPFASEERANLKKHFKVAAKRELQQLDMDRMYEIPTIIVVSGESHNVVTMSGVDDLKEKGSEALIHWIKLLHSLSNEDNKFY